MTETSLTPAYEPLSRFQLLPSPVAIPGKCAVCGTSTRPVVDFGMTLEFYGAVYLCETCLTEAARAIGMVSISEYNEAKEGSSQSFSENLLARDMVAIPRGQYDALSVALRNLSSLILPVSFGGLTVVESPPIDPEPNLFDATEGDAGIFSSGGDESIAGESGTSEQEPDSIIDEGPTSLSSSSRDGSSFIL